MKVENTHIEGLKVITLDRFADNRGSFSETYSKKELANHGVYYEFVQDNESISKQHVLRGLHYQEFPEGQVKLVRCSEGEIIDVAVDIRPSSKTYLEHFMIVLTGENNHALLIPKGFLHGFIVMSETARVNYKCSWYYEPKLEKGIAYNDPTLAIPWPVENPILSDKDKCNPKFLEVFQNFQ